MCVFVLCVLVVCLCACVGVFGVCLWGGVCVVDCLGAFVLVVGLCALVFVVCLGVCVVFLGFGSFRGVLTCIGAFSSPGSGSDGDGPLSIHMEQRKLVSLNDAFSQSRQSM